MDKLCSTLPTREQFLKQLNNDRNERPLLHQLRKSIFGVAVCGGGTYPGSWGTEGLEEGKPQLPTRFEFCQERLTLRVKD